MVGLQHAMKPGSNLRISLQCVQNVGAEQILLRVPLKVAITDYEDDDESNSLVYEDAPWGERLACKVLRERARGEESPWFPYMQVGAACGVTQCGWPWP